MAAKAAWARSWQSAMSWAWSAGLAAALAAGLAAAGVAGVRSAAASDVAGLVGVGKETSVGRVDRPITFVEHMHYTNGRAESNIGERPPRGEAPRGEAPLAVAPLAVAPLAGPAPP